MGGATEMLSSEVIELIKVARNVIKLSDWRDCPICGEPCFRTSKIAVEALRQTCDRCENPSLRLAPEGIEPGTV